MAEEGIFFYKESFTDISSIRPMLYFPDGSSNDTWVITLKYSEGEDTLEIAESEIDNVYQSQINRHTGLPESYIRIPKSMGN